MKLPLILVGFSLVLASPLFAQEPASTEAKGPAAHAQTVKNVSPEEAAKLLQEKKGIVVLDVRTPAEYAGGHIAGAQNLDFHSPDFAQKVGALDPSKSYLVHCAAGGRSSKVVGLMAGDKFSEVYHMNAGFKGWVEAGKPVEK